MEKGTNKSLYTLIAVVVFGIFLSLSYWMFQDQFKSVFASIFDGFNNTSHESIGSNDSENPANSYYEDPTVVPNADTDFVFDSATGTITDYIGVATKVVIPYEIRGVNVVAIGSNSFKGEYLTELTLPSTITEIKDYAFSTNKLISLDLPDSVEALGAHSFDANPTLTTVRAGDNLDSIGAYSFSGSGLSSIKLNEGITSIGSYAFKDTKIQFLIIPKTVTTLGTYLVNSTYMKSIMLPLSLKSKVIASTFSPVSNDLIHYYDDAGNAPILDSDFYIDSNGIIVGYTGNASNITVPSTLAGITVKGIGSGVFKSNAQLSSISLPDSVESIGTSAFYNSALTSVDLGSSLKTIETNAFMGSKLTSVVLPDSVTSINSDAFRMLYTLTNVEFGSGLKTIGTGAFAYTGLTSVNLNVGLTTISQSAFSNTKLKVLIVPPTVTSIGRYVTDDVILKYAMLPKALQAGVDNYTFDLSTSYINYYEGDMPILVDDFYIDSNGRILGYMGTDSNLSIPSSLSGRSVVGLGNAVFVSNSTLTSVSLPDSLITIENHTFSNSALSSVSFGSGLKTIGISAFASTKLTSIVLPDSLELINSSGFNGSYYLTSVKFGSGLKTIENWAFGNTGLTHIDLNEGLTTINSSAFTNTKLKVLIIPTTVTSIGNYAFDTTTITSVMVPKSLQAKVTNYTFPISNSYINYYEGSRPIYNNGYYIDSNGIITAYTGTDSNLVIPSSISGRLVKGIGNAVFASNKTITSVTLPNGLETINQYAFNNATNLTSITFPNTLTSIGNYAFSSTGLTSVALPSTLTALGSYVFSSSKITTASIPTSLQALVVSRNIFYGQTPVITYY